MSSDQLLAPGDHVVCMNDVYGGEHITVSIELIWFEFQARTGCFVNYSSPKASRLAASDLFNAHSIRLISSISRTQKTLCNTSNQQPRCSVLAHGELMCSKLVWTESPTNPLMAIADIRGIAEKVHAASSEILVVVDNTFLSAYNQRPLDLGADVEFASVTKYYNGRICWTR